MNGKYKLFKTFTVHRVPHDRIVAVLLFFSVLFLVIFFFTDTRTRQNKITKARKSRCIRRLFFVGLGKIAKTGVAQ